MQTTQHRVRDDLIAPRALWDVGFQLSFAATLGLILFAPALERLFEQGLGRIVSPDRARQGTRFLYQALIITLAAQILTLPLVVYHFGRLSLVAPLANLLILPVQAPIMALGGAAAVVGVPAIAWVPWLCLACTNAVVRWLDNGRPDEDAVYAQCMARLEKGAVTRQVVRAGDRLELGSGIVLEVLHPGPELLAAAGDSANNNSLVLRLA